MSIRKNKTRLSIKAGLLLRPVGVADGPSIIWTFFGSLKLFDRLCLADR